jgi:hypothetical protein
MSDFTTAEPHPTLAKELWYVNFTLGVMDRRPWDEAKYTCF